jgi:hypothetical protein
MSGIQVRTLVVGSLPLVALAPSVAGEDQGLGEVLRDRGVGPVPAVLGHELPKGGRVAFHLVGDELQLLDDRETTLLRAPRGGLDAAWCEAALRLRGTMLVAVDALDLRDEVPVDEVVRGLDQRAHDGAALGAIVGVAEQRPTLPLLFG